MIGSCIDKELFKVTSLFEGSIELINPAVFVNCQLGIINNLIARIADKQLMIEGLLGGISLTVSLEEANNLALLYNTFASFGGGFTITLPITGVHGPYIYTKVAYTGHHAMAQYQAITDFFSGRLAVFPVGVLSATVPGVVVLGTMTFAGALGVAYGEKMSDNTLCQLDHDNPCASINLIFGGILGAFDAVLNAMLAGLDLLLDLRNNILDIIAQITGYINSIIQFIIQSINALIEALAKAIRFSLARLMISLKLDPCLSAVLGAVAGPQLKLALSI